MHACYMNVDVQVAADTTHHQCQSNSRCHFAKKRLPRPKCHVEAVISDGDTQVREVATDVGGTARVVASHSRTHRSQLLSLSQRQQEKEEEEEEEEEPEPEQEQQEEEEDQGSMLLSVAARVQGFRGASVCTQ